MLIPAHTIKNWIIFRMNKRFYSVKSVALTLVLVVVLFEFSSIDAVLQSLLYSGDSQVWMIDRNNLLYDLIFYSGIKKIFIVFILILLFSLIFLRKFDWVRNNSKGMVIVVLSGFIVPLTVGALKDATNMPCPNQLVEYGGQYQHVGLFEKLNSEQQRPATKCYPAGHASGGFSLLALLFLVAAGRSRKITLTLVMVLAWSTAAYKMLIGDHFLSHSVVTMVLAWLIILLIVHGVDKIENRFFNKNN